MRTDVVLRRENTEQIQRHAHIHLADPISRAALSASDGWNSPATSSHLKHLMPEINRTFHYAKHICCTEQCLVML